MYWLQISLWWYFVLLILGLIAYPVTKIILGKFSLDNGYPFAKVIAILLISYLSFIFGITKILPFNQISLIITILVFALINLILAKRKSKTASNTNFSLIIFEELLFLISFIFWTVIRGQEPSIHSLEKFMDFGFINSILRANYFPPLDIWYSGYPINYYYFGHLTGAAIIKLTGVIPAIGYNLILSTIFALGMTQVFSLVINIINLFQKTVRGVVQSIKLVFLGFLGACLVNFAGNLHTIYLFTKGYPNENPVPFWTILSWFNPTKYWYPNATRFIPFTIHEFPSYSYVVADLHGHVFDIPFVLLTIAILFIVFIKNYKDHSVYRQNSKFQIPNLKQIFKFKFTNLKQQISTNFNQFQLISTFFLGFLTAVHYMTNAFDGPIYLLLSFIIFFIIYRFSLKFLYSIFIILFSFVLFSFPFSYHFKPFVSGIGVNCSPEFLTKIGRIGPFLFEKGNCQISPLWMLFILWGFFWINFIIFLLIRFKSKKLPPTTYHLTNFIFLLFSFGTFLIIIPEFFYIKDIYPAHFRANTMFKLGYQAFIMMGIASTIVFYQIKRISNKYISFLFSIFYILFSMLVLIYPFFSIPSYYGSIKKPVELNGAKWIIESYPEDKEIIDYLNKHETKQPTILEAQGDSYTDYERISAFTGLPTVAGWWVHEWLWRGSSTIISDRIPDVVFIYESNDIKKTMSLIKKYQIKYIIISRLERQKYPNLNEEKITKIGKLLYKSSNGFGALYQIN